MPCEYNIKLECQRQSSVTGLAGAFIICMMFMAASVLQQWSFVVAADPWSFKYKWQPTPIFLPGKFHGQSSPVGYSPWGPREADTAECARTLIQPLYI